MRSPPAFVDVAKNHREGSWWSSTLNCVKEVKETGGDDGGGVLNPKDVI